MQLQRTTMATNDNDNAILSMGNCVIWNVEEFILFLNIIVGPNKSRCYSILYSLRMRSTAERRPCAEGRTLYRLFGPVAIPSTGGNGRLGIIVYIIEAMKLHLRFTASRHYAIPAPN